MTAQTAEEVRYQRGLEQLGRVSGGAAGERPFAALDGICPDLGRYTVEFVFGEMLARPGLSLGTRELVTVAALAALGTARPQLAYHVGGALNLGWSAADVVAAIRLAAPHAGSATAAESLGVAREVFTARGDTAALGLLDAPAPGAGPGLEPATERLATLALLAALGTAAPRLVEHLRAARAAGCSRDEIVEVLLQMAIYAGFPAAINALAAYRDQLAAA